MTVHNIQVTATDNTKSAFANIERSLGALNAMGSKVTGTFAALIGGLSVGKVIEVSKEWQNFEIALKSVSAAGTDTKALLKSLADASSGTTASVGDMVEAYRQLKLAGLDASTETIKSLKNLSAAGGIELGRTAELVGKAFRGEFGKLDDFGVEVENRYGQFVIKYQGQTKAIVSNTRQVVDEIIKLSNTNASFSDAAAAKAKSLDGQLSVLKGNLEKGIGTSNIADSLAQLVGTLNKLVANTNGIAAFFNGIGTAIQGVTYVIENFGGVIASVLGVLFIGKISKMITAATTFAGSFVGALTSGKVAVLSISASMTTFERAVKSLITNTGKVFISLAGTLLGVKNAYLTAGGALSYLTLAVGAAFKVLVRFAGVAGLIYTVVEALQAMEKAFLGTDYLTQWGNSFGNVMAGAIEWVTKLLSKVPLIGGIFDYIYKKQQQSSLPAAGGMSEGDVADEIKRMQGRANAAAAANKPAGGDGKLANTFLQDLIGNFGKARGELAMLEAAMKKTKDANLLALMFEEASSRAEKFGIVLQKPIELIQRDFVLANKKAFEENYRFAARLTNTSEVLTEYRNEVYAAQLETAKLTIRYSDTNTVINELKNGLAQSSIELLKQNILLGNDALLQEKWAQEIQQTSNSLTEQSLKLADSAYMATKFRQELQQTTLNLQENAMKLADAGYQSTVFGQNLQKSRQDVEQQKITLDLLNKTFKAGDMTLREYTDALKGVDERMLGVDQLKAMAQATREQTRAEFERSKALRDSYSLYEEIQMVAEDSTKKAGDALTQNLTDAIRTGKGLLSSFKDFFNQILTDIANAIIKKQFVNPIVDSLSGLMSGKGGAGGGIASSIGNIFSGDTGGGLSGIWNSVTSWFGGLTGRATGGPVNAGTPYIVGEQGPELFMPNSSGNIIPNGAGAGQQPIVVNLNLSAIDTQSGVEFLVQNRAVITGVVQQAFNRNAKNGFA